MRRSLFPTAFCCLLAASIAWTQQAATLPSEGYNIHVTAPHLVNGKVMGPFHHYCKVVSPEPQIICLIYDSTEPNAMLTQVEYIMAKSLTRKSVSLTDWNKLWHDHAVEIAGGRVKVLDLPPDKAKEVADIVATTDGIIYNFDFSAGLPNGHVTMAQAVGHTPLSPADYEKSKGAKAAAPGPSPELVGMLAQNLSITPQQAAGGAGALFGLAKSRLSAGDFSKVASAVPGMDGLLKAAPASSGSSALGSLGSLASELPGEAGGLVSAYESFKSLGLSPEVALKMAPMLSKYVESKGGAGVASILSGALK